MENINSLQNRKIPRPDDNLADKIVTASYKVEQQQHIWKLLISIFTELKIPSPAYSFAILIILGFLISGVSNKDNSETTAISQLYQYEQYMEDLI